MTNDIWRRVRENKHETTPGCASKSRIHRLVYFEEFKYVGNGIAREKRLKGWLRERKVALIYSVNPTWEDLGEKCLDGKNVIHVKLDKSAGEKQVLRCAQDDKS